MKMKKFLIADAVCLALMLVFAGQLFAAPANITVSDSKQPIGVNGKSVAPTSLATDQRTWQTIVTVASAGEEPNDLAVTERTYTTIAALAEGGDDKITIVRIPTAWSYIRFRCIGISDNNAVTFQVYSGTLANGTNCELVKMAQLAFTIGTQASTTATYEMADTLTLTSYCNLKTLRSVSPTGELVAEGGWDLLGDDVLVIVPTTVECNAKLQAKGF